MFAPILGFIIAVLAVVSALFSGFETAFFLLRPYQVRRLSQKNPQLSQRLELLFENPRKLLGALLFGASIADVPLVILLLFLMHERVSAFLPFWLMTLLVFSAMVVVCDLIPKLVALRQPYWMIRIGGAVLGVCMPRFDLILGWLQRWSEAVAGAITPVKFQSNHVLNRDELATLVQLSADEGALLKTESAVILELIKLGDKIVKDCMTPRIDAFTIPDDLSNAGAIARLRQGRYRLVPVYAETPDNIVGILNTKLFLANPAIHYTEGLIPPSFVSETMKALDLLHSFLTHRQGLAVIIDEFGGTEGIITLADLLDDLIGEALPSGNREFPVQPIAEGSILVSGATRLDDLSERGFQLEADGIDTVGGLVFNRLGYLPKAGADIWEGDVRLTVRRASRKRIEAVLITRELNEPGEEVGS